MEINRVAVLGAGLMGRGIAHVAALGGYQVTLQDISEEILTRAIGVITKNLQKGVEIGKLSNQAKEEALNRICPATSLPAAVEAADFVIEAVPEDINLKHQVFMELDRLCPPHVVMGTNTSAKSITEIAAVTKRPQMVVGMHFFNPAHIMKLVEIVRGLESCDLAVAITKEVAARMGKETVEINEFPGFATSRINAMIGNEAFYMLMEGVASARDIDKSLKLGLNHPMGPFEMGDLVGWDTRLKVLEYLHVSLGEKFRPCPLLVKYVKAGRLGRKVGVGVYDYRESAE